MNLSNIKPAKGSLRMQASWSRVGSATAVHPRVTKEQSRSVQL